MIFMDLWIYGMEGDGRKWGEVGFGIAGWRGGRGMPREIGM